MDRPLETYRRKRDFKITPEPRPRATRRRDTRRFVIQKHAASHLHYDFRLELDGVLVSWAVPKEPSDRIGVRRLAVHVEDHPVDYAKFEGDIPPGQYGAGHVDIWDRGTWTPVGDPRRGLREGHLKFDLDGQRLHGRYVLVRMKPRDGERHENWLLIRERSEEEAEIAAAKPRSKPAGVRVTVAGVSISNPSRALVQMPNVSKLDVVRYHESVAKWLLPQITTRPLALVRCPGSDFARCFFQKHPVNPSRPGQSVVDSEPYTHLADLHAVIEAVQNGAIEFHTWGSSFPRIDRPDRITLDLDPDASMSWSTVREGAEIVRALLDRLDLRWFLKTTGGKGLHFVLPIVRRYDWDEAKAFAQAIARTLVDEHSSLFVATASKAKRGERIFVDYLRNAEQATAVAAYALRAREGLPVSMPVDWTALEKDVRGAYFNIGNVPQMLAKRRRDPWASYAQASQAITKAARALRA
jgi:bifunctional non-homologous end joining protein LigD